MDVYLCFLLVYFSCIQASWCYFVSKTTAVWTKQYAECNMATPTIQYEKPELYLTIDQQFQYHDLWIGYYEHMALFDYIGCIKTRNVQPILATIQLGVPTPGRCYSACAYTQYIGISKRECYCFDTKPGGKITEQGCNSPCGDMSQTVCGGKDHISLYKTSAKDTDLVANRGDDKCLQMNFRTGEKYKWRNCNDEMWASCLSDFQQSVKIWRKSKTWNDAAKVCFKLNSYPTPVERINHVTDTNVFSWTGVVRSGVISKNADLASMSSDIMHGYMTYDDSSGYTLKFTQANDRKYILCENATVTVKPNAPMRTSVTTAQEYQLTTSRNGSSSNVTDTQKVTEASNPTITVSYATATQVNGSTMSLNDNSYNGKNTQGSDVTVIVIVSVSVVMLIVTVVVILIQIKRKKIPFLCKRELTTEEPGQKHLKSTKNPASHENHSYELVDVEDNVIGGQSTDSNYTHTYNVLEEHVKDPITDDTTYDVSGDNRKTTETENENIYNKLKPDDNATYDHAYNTTKHGLQTPDITYGTSGNAGMKPLARAAENSDAFDENGENAYSHTLDNRPHMTTTDNVYSAHGQSGNDTRNTGEGHNDTEDAYSHINNATNGKSKQDIAYGKITEASWCYFVSKTTAAWTEQYAECKMATPTIQYERLELNVTIDQQFQYHDLWVGYYEHMALFDYIGCIKTRNVQPILATIQLGVPTPGRCYSACAYTQYIGINKRKCYCFDTKPGGKITEQGCNLPCDDMSQTVCGGKDHISLYKTSTKDTDLVANRGGDKCLQINFFDGEKYNWRDCNGKMLASCTSDFQQPVIFRRKSKTWNDAAKLCFKHNSYPTPVESINHVTDTNFFSWTGVVRSGVISKNTDLASMSSDIMHGYMTYDDSSGYTLKFTRQANDRKYILCENANVTVKPNTPVRTSVTTTQEYQLTTSRNGSSSNVTDTQTDVTEASNPTITVSYATPTQVNGSTMSLNDNSYNGKNTQGTDATVIVIVSVSVVMLIVIVVVILIQVKRKKIPFLCKRELTTEEPGQNRLKSTKNPTSHENHSYELVDVEDNVIGGQSADSNYTHTYNVLEEHVKDSITDDTTYDVSGNNRKTTETENENIYNKLKPDDNVTYDHAYNTTKHGLQTPDITYGTSGNAGMKPLARAAKNSDAFDENGENAYSHTLDNRPHTTTTDNVYSAHGQAGNDTGDGHNDTEDAYSHIHNATNGRSKQDIAYGKITEGNLKENSEGDYDVTDEHSCSPNVDNEY